IAKVAIGSVSQQRADPRLGEHLPRPAEVAQLRRAVRVVGAHAEPLHGAAVADDGRARPADAEHPVAPLAGEDALGVEPVLHPQELAGVRVPGDGAVERGVPVLPPVRDAAVPAQRHLLHLVEHVSVRARRAAGSAPVVGDVEVHRVLRLAEVRRRRRDVAHEHAHLGVDLAERRRVEVAEPGHVGHERRRAGERDGEGDVVGEDAPRAAVPWAGGGEEEAVVLLLQAAHARAGGLDAVLVAHHRVPGEGGAVVGEAVRQEVEHLGDSTGC
ncbi:Os04g0360650, partial [Oryza sativa Japonica Group]